MPLDFKDSSTCCKKTGNKPDLNLFDIQYLQWRTIRTVSHLFFDSECRMNFCPIIYISIKMNLLKFIIILEKLWLVIHKMLISLLAFGGALFDKMRFT